MSAGLFVAALLSMTVTLLFAVGGAAYMAHRRNRAVSPIILFAGALVFVLGGSALFAHSNLAGVAPDWARIVLNAAAYLSVAFLSLAILDALMIGEFLIERRGRSIPDIVRHLILGIGMATAAVIILRLVLNINVLALVALPTVAAAVVGVALKDTLARFFAGIELGKMVKVGDWIMTLEREGMVAHIGLEHVTLVTREQDWVSLPNNNVIQAGVINYSRPTTTHMCSIHVEAAYRIPPSRVCATLVDAAAAVEGVLKEPRPVAMVTGFQESGVQYKVKFPIGDYARSPQIESTVRTYVWNAFSRNGIEIPFPQRVIHQSEASERGASHPPTEELLRFLAAVDFLAVLNPVQLETVVRASRVEQFLSGERVVRQGDSGQELYVIMEGCADVVIEKNGLSTVVNQLTVGQFFGEMSLLTGEPRSATVIARTSLRVIAVGKDSLVRVVQEDQRSLERIGEVIARRQEASLAATQELDRQALSAVHASPARRLVERIQQFLWGQAKV